MKNIRVLIVTTLVGIFAFFGNVQPVLAQKIFVERAVMQKDIVTEPELKQVLPLVYLDEKIENEGNFLQTDTDLFAPLFVDNSKGIVRKSVTSEKVMPIESDAILGISTYFTRFHAGVDYRAKVGTSIRAILPGTVNEVSYDRGGYGRYLVLVHHVDGKTLFSLYAHMRISNVAVGDSVEAGDVIGEVGLTGRTTGPHLHFELHDTKSAMNPVTFFKNTVLAMVVNK